MDYIKSYIDTITSLMNTIEETQREQIDKAAGIMADCTLGGHWLHAVGTGGHSAMPTMELLCRMGGPAAINIIYDPGITGSHGLYKAICGSEVVPGYAKTFLQYNKVAKGDALLITSAFGANVVTIETAEEAKRLGAYTIAVTSPAFSNWVPPHHPMRPPSGKSLYQVADLVIDSQVPPEDCVVDIEGLPDKAMQVSSILQIFTVNTLIGRYYKELVDRGVQPERWICALVDDAKETNDALYHKYGGRVKSL